MVLIALALGIFHIATTTIVSKDSVKYINEALSLKTGIPQNSNDYLGYLFLISNILKLINSITTPGPELIAASLQLFTILTQVLALIFTYLFAKRIFGKDRAFISVLILAILPQPSQFAADVLREWPHLAFLMMAMYFLLLAIEKNKLQWFAACGIAALTGLVIRPESSQIFLYAIVLLISLAVKHKITIAFASLAAVTMLICFLTPAIIYSVTKDTPLPSKLDTLIKTVKAPSAAPALADQPHITVRAAAGLTQLGKALSQNLMYFFLPFALIGFFHSFIKKTLPGWILLLFASFALFNVIILVVLFVLYGYISDRHALPLTAILCLFVPHGFDLVAKFVSRASCQHEYKTNLRLLFIGICICLPQLLTPIRHDKQWYLQTSNWLNSNTPADAFISAFDPRLYFYASRKGTTFTGAIPPQADYIVAELDQQLDSNQLIELKTIMAENDDADGSTIYKVIRNQTAKRQ